MDDLLELWERPHADETYMIAGWQQWADAGSVSSGLPEYIINQMGARKIGRMKADPFYIFQVPGTHHYFRPEIKLEDGYRKELRPRRNDIYFAGDEHKGLIVFWGEEPHLSVERYAEAFFNIAREFNAKRVAALGGVYGAVPYHKDREITCTYSLPRLKPELSDYAVRFSNYEGGVSIGSYLADRAELLEVEYFTLYALVPMYDLSKLSPRLQGMTVEEDWKAWHDVMRRINHMFKLGFDLSDLERKSRELIASLDARMDELSKKMPQAQVKEYLRKISDEFEELSFLPLDDVWETGLGDVLKDM